MQALKKDDFDRFWLSLGQCGAASVEFEQEIKLALRGYSYDQKRPPKVSANVRKAAYDPLEKAIQRIVKQLSDPADWLTIELAEASMDFEPPDFGDWTLSDMGDYEGLDWSDVKRHRILDELSELSKIITLARSENSGKRGRPKQNSELEIVIQRLAGIFAQTAEQEPSKGYYFDPLDPERPYKGPFLDFVYDVIWSHNGKDVPAGGSIGDAARRVLKVRS